MKKSVLLTLGFISSLMFVTTAFAENTSNVKINTSGSDVDVKVNSKINSSSYTSINSGSSTNINLHTSGDGDNEVIINNNKFNIKGKITNIENSTFSVSNQKIELNSAKITGTLQVDKTVEVKGSIVNSKLLAEEIFVENSSSPQISPTNSPNSSSSASPSPQASDDGQVLGEKTEKNAIEQIIQTLENIINSLKNLL